MSIHIDTIYIGGKWITPKSASKIEIHSPATGEPVGSVIANDSEYGLGGSVWSPDHDHAVAVATRIQSGTVGINHYLPDITAPYGGIKNSGLGRELGPEGLQDFQNIKSIFLP
jgi:acyl-CoA reductase-like NAD-dependent aldehyde dehydrogenase